MAACLPSARTARSWSAQWPVWDRKSRSECEVTEKGRTRQLDRRPRTAGIGASRALPFVPAKVPCLITQRTFSQSGGNRSSCPTADLRGSAQTSDRLGETDIRTIFLRGAKLLFRQRRTAVRILTLPATKQVLRFRSLDAVITWP